MEFEHFGIAVVELMSSGIITIAHNSAGPKADIIGKAPYPVGHLGDGLDTYSFFAAKSMINYDDTYYVEMRRNARKWVKDQFGIEAFDSQFIGQMAQLV